MKFLKKLRLNAAKSQLGIQFRAFEQVTRDRNIECFDDLFSNVTANRLSLRTNRPPQKFKVAVCLGGFLRTYEQVAQSWLNNIIHRYDADVFIAAPRTSGASALIGDNKENEGSFIEEKKLESLYGSNLKDIYLWDYDPRNFSEMIDIDHIKRRTNHPQAQFPERFVSYAFHIKKAAQLRAKYTNRNACHYDVVIRSRGDLSIVSPLELEVLDFRKYDLISPHRLEISKKGKFATIPNIVERYANLKDGVFFGGRNSYFSDFMHISNEKNADLMAELLDHVPSYVERKVPFHFETLFYYHAAITNKMRISDEQCTNYIVAREDTPMIISDHYIA